MVEPTYVDPTSCNNIAVIMDKLKEMLLIGDFSAAMVFHWL